MEDIETDVESGMRELNVPGSIRFSIKADDTPQNAAIHKAFKSFCEEECGNNYTLGLGKLLEYYQDDARYESLWQHVVSMMDRIAVLESKDKTVVKEEPKQVKKDSFEVF